MKLRITDVPNVEMSDNRRGLYATRNHFPLIARILMSSIFIWSGISTSQLLPACSLRQAKSSY